MFFYFYLLEKVFYINIKITFAKIIHVSLKIVIMKLKYPIYLIGNISTPSYILEIYRYDEIISNTCKFIICFHHSSYLSNKCHILEGPHPPMDKEPLMTYRCYRISKPSGEGYGYCVFNEEVSL